MRARAEAALPGKRLGGHAGESEDGSHSHHWPRKAAGLQVPRGCAGRSYLQPQRSPLLRGWGQDLQRPPTPSLALLRRRGDGLHFPRRGPRWPVLGLGLGHRPPGARRLPSLQKEKKKEWKERERRGAEAGERGGGGSPSEGRTRKVSAGQGPSLSRSRPYAPGGRVPSKSGRWRWTERARERTGQRNELRGKEHPRNRRGRAGEKLTASSASGGPRWGKSCRLTRRPPPGTNCSSGPYGKLRRLTDGARPQRLQLPETPVHRPQNAWHRWPLPYPGMGRGSGRVRLLRRAFGNYSSRRALGLRRGRRPERAQAGGKQVAPAQLLMSEGASGSLRLP